MLGLGYVGLPLAHALGAYYPTTGFDINKQRVDEIKSGFDRNLALNSEDFKSSRQIHYTANIADLADAQVYIITAPTPVNQQKQPDLEPVLNAARMVGKHLSQGNIVIFESTVYPGATEEECVPVLEAVSGLSFNKDFSLSG